jgi:hypothetical protein
MAKEIRNLVRDVVAAPLGDVIASVGEGVAAAQAALDEGSLSKTLEIYSEAGDEGAKFLRDIGYRPTFYALPETTGEVTIAMTLGNKTAGTSQAGRRIVSKSAPQRLSRSQAYVTPVDGGYANKFGYDAKVSTKLTFKIVPIPAPEGIDDIRVIPALKGMSGTAALERADEFNLDVIFVDKHGNVLENPKMTLLVKSQIPEGGEIARAGDDISVVL